MAVSLRSMALPFLAQRPTRAQGAAMPAHYMGSLPRLGIWGLFRGSAGPQPPLLNRELFEAVQRRLTEQRSHHVTTRTKNDALLKGILFDAAGDPMVPTHATKRGRNS